VKPFKKILVPIADFSAHANEVIETAADVSRRYEAPVTLLHVWEPEQPSAADTQQLRDRSPGPRVLAEVARLLDQACRDLRAAGVMEIDTQQLQGAPAAEIVRMARAGGYDLIVLGTHRRTGVGSVAEHVLRTSPCAVLTARLPEEHFDHPWEEPASRHREPKGR